MKTHKLFREILSIIRAGCHQFPCINLSRFFVLRKCNLLISGAVFLVFSTNLACAQVLQQPDLPHKDTYESENKAYRAHIVTEADTRFIWNDVTLLNKNGDTIWFRERMPHGSHYQVLNSGILIGNLKVHRRGRVSVQADTRKTVIYDTRGRVIDEFHPKLLSFDPEFNQDQTIMAYLTEEDMDNVPSEPKEFVRWGTHHHVPDTGEKILHIYNLKEGVKVYEQTIPIKKEWRNLDYDQYSLTFEDGKLFIIFNKTENTHIKVFDIGKENVRSIRKIIHPTFIYPDFSFENNNFIYITDGADFLAINKNSGEQLYQSLFAHGYLIRKSWHNKKFGLAVLLAHRVDSLRNQEIDFKWKVIRLKDEGQVLQSSEVIHEPIEDVEFISPRKIKLYFSNSVETIRLSP